VARDRLACQTLIRGGAYGVRGPGAGVRSGIWRVRWLTDGCFLPGEPDANGNRRQPTFSDSVLHLPALSGARSARVTAARPASRRHRHGIGRQSRRDRVVAARRGRALSIGANGGATLICDPSARAGGRGFGHQIDTNRSCRGGYLAMCHEVSRQVVALVTILPLSTATRDLIEGASVFDYAGCVAIVCDG
jgi:hypothetical protein